jgi:hypothetical protein
MAQGLFTVLADRHITPAVRSPRPERAIARVALDAERASALYLAADRRPRTPAEQAGFTVSHSLRSL